MRLRFLDCSCLLLLSTTAWSLGPKSSRAARRYRYGLGYESAMATRVRARRPFLYKRNALPNAALHV